MAIPNPDLHLEEIGLSGADLTVHFPLGSDREETVTPAFLRLELNRLFLQWDNPPPEVRRIKVVWADCPFTGSTFHFFCSVERIVDGGIEAAFEGQMPASMRDWYGRIASAARLSEPNSALRTSQLYTMATVVSASGLFCGALAILLPLLSSGQWWIDILSKLLLLLMVCSIAGFAWIRLLAGREEVRAIRQSAG